MKNVKTWLVTGASQGIGLELVKQLLANGDNVIATTRNSKKLTDALSDFSPQLLAIDTDITNESSIANAVMVGNIRFGTIDYLINNAGYGLLGGIEECSASEVQANFDINVFGLLNMTRAVLPIMREAGSGTIINISSVFGLIAGAGWGIYCATKFAVEAISEALEQEIKPFGIKVIIIEPGYIRTAFLDSGSVITPANIVAEYTDIAEIRRKHKEDLPGTQAGDPVKVASVIIKTALLNAPPLRLLLGSDAVQYATYKADMLLTGIENNKKVSVSINYA
ncbi:SDR family oxidoreductase [Flavobacterium zepuense]|uniref:SDR family oxidoreductase n=1 Tax=Flavobacterium zepuense TaxID=2593302 RepID=A0A552V9Z2_9FLAO|nr:SDR family oxidoreductase [Flavobacterium zepuense]TRW27284.1 SDR family oxidoreductase [Flavobacterium zepuense]